LTRGTGIGVGSAVCDGLGWSLLVAAELLLRSEEVLCRQLCMVPPAEHWSFGRAVFEVVLRE